VLDVGCGGGLFLAMLAERSRPGIGLDRSPEAAAVAWRHKRIPAVCASLDFAPFRSGTVAAVTMFHVLEHLPQPQTDLAGAYRILQPQGRLIVQVPNAASWQFAVLGRRWNGLDVPRHLHNFRESDLTALLAGAGFSVVRRKHFSLRDNPAGLATSLAPSLDPMARRVRQRVESPAVRIARDLVYLGLTAAAVPFALLEAAFGRGSTIMLEARKS
jgi:SAM-dependent methyltransferase